MKRPCMVFYKHDDCVLLPMGWEKACGGALCVDEDAPVLFPDRRAAQRAIRISKAHARLQLAQGKVANSDFTVGIKQVVIVNVMLANPEAIR